MKLILYTTLFVFTLGLSAQTPLRFENRKIYLGNINIENVYSINFNYENLSNESLSLAYEPITNLINAQIPKTPIAPNTKGSIKVSFYPEQEGPFNERLYIMINDKDKIELSLYGSVNSMSKSYKSLTESNKLFGDRDIAFMVVDAQTYQGIPFSKVFIKNISNNKSYIGLANKYGVLINRIPEGKYSIQALINNYNKDILDIKLDANKNIAMILLERTEPKDSFIKKIIPPQSAIISAKPMDTEVKITVVDTIPTLTPVAVKNEETIAAVVPPQSVQPVEIATTNKSDVVPAAVEVNSPKSDESQERKPLNIILLIDVSKSMEKQGRIDVLKESIVNLVHRYAQKDYLAVLTFNDQVNRLISRSQITDKTQTIDAINSIQPSGTTDGVLGIDQAFTLLKENYMPEAINMVILATDGKINKYVSDDKLMLEKIEKMNEEGILTSIIGFATSSYYQTKLQQISELGGGVFIDMTDTKKNYENALLDEVYSILQRVE